MRRRKISLKVTLVIALIFSVIAGLTPLGGQASYGAEKDKERAAMDKTAIADPSTVATWTDIAKDSTQYVGRIWTDKTVSEDVIALPASDAGNTFDIAKGEASDFIVGLSAISSTSNIKTMTDKPLDIVMVLDRSGSMANDMVGTPIYAADLNKSNTYYLEDGSQVRYYDKGLFGQSEGWYKVNLIGRGYRVYPKTGANDNTAGHTQLFADKKSRMEALKGAVNSFIDATVLENNKITGTAKHRISLVSYGNNATNNMSLTVCEGEDAEKLKSTVNDLRASGATQADLGMEAAQEELKNSRADAQKVVIFFTDGTPTSGNQFEADVANAAIGTAKSLKTDNTLIYSIGIFNGANPEGSSNEDSFMNGVSSNYPKAEAYNKLGSRVDEKAAYYKTAADAGQLNNVFTEIFDEISSSTGFPTHIGGSAPADRDGYVNITDKLGQYMQVDKFHTIVYADEKYTEVNKTTSGNKDTYIFQGKNTGNVLYPQAELSKILITVTKADSLSQGDTVEVKIPAALIPLRNFDVESEDGLNYDTKVTEAFPMRIFYDVSLKEDAKELIKSPDKEMKSYIDKNSSDGKVSFYSNDFTTGEALGNTTSVFTPAKSNNFYYFTQDTMLYTDEACTNPLTTKPSDSGSYYYQREYYSVGDSQPQKEIIKLDRLGLDSLADVAKPDSQSRYYIPKGMPRLTTVAGTTLSKTSNDTKTATEVISPNWDNPEVLNAEKIIVSLGNNGKLDVELPGELVVKKNVTADSGFNAPKDAEFNFKLHLTDNKGQGVGETFTAKKYNADGSQDGPLFNIVNGAVFKLKAGQTLKVENLDAGTNYKVEETDVPEGFTQTAPTGAAAAEGVIAAGESSSAEFTNNYSAEEKIVRLTELGITGTKTLTGRAFRASDSFTFKMQQIDEKNQFVGKPLTAEVKGSGNIGKAEADISFGNEATLTFDKPGSYRYMIFEELPSTLEPGITYDNASYALSFDVADEGDGQLHIRKLKIEKGVEGNPWEELYYSEEGKYPQDKYLNFTNSYSAQQQSVTIAGQKEMTNKNLDDYTAAEQFGFSIEAAGVRTVDSNEAFDTAQISSQPMPAPNASGKYIYRNLTDGDITISGITYKTENVGKEYKYVVRELQPTNTGKHDGEPLEGAVKNSSNKWVYKGVTFDNSEKIIIVKVKTKPDPEDSQKELIATELVDETGAEYQYFRFNNSYNASAELKITGEKNITGRDFRQGDKYTFEITGKSGAPLPSGVTPTGEEKGTVTINPEQGGAAVIDFGSIAYTEDDVADGTRKEEIKDGKTIFTFTKTFTYTIKELGTDANGMSLDKEERTVKVTVTDDSHGKMTAELTADSDELSWTNAYESSMDYGDEAGGLQVNKTLNGRQMNKDEFSFSIQASDTQVGKVTREEAHKLLPEEDKVFKNHSNAKDGEALTMTRLANMKFTHNHAGKTFTYDISEKIGNAGGVAYDKTMYRVAIEVIDDYDGTMHTVTTITKVRDKDGNAVSEEIGAYDSSKAETPSVAFVNTYQADPAQLDTNAAFTKILEGRSWADSESFEFILTPVTEDAPMPLDDWKNPVDNVTVTKPAQGNEKNFGFGTIIFDSEGTYKYEVREVNGGSTIDGLTYSANVGTLIVEVNDTQKNGQLTATPQLVNPIFYNEYNAELEYSDFGQIGIYKTLKGTDMTEGQFEFKIMPKDDISAKKFNISKEGDMVGSPKADRNAEALVAAAGNVTYDEKDIGKSYGFSVEEVKGNAPGVTYDNAKYDVDITITDSGNGHLQAVTLVKSGDDYEKTYTWNSENIPQEKETIKLTFENSYSAITDPGAALSISGTKTLIGKTLKANEYTFVIKDSKGAQVASGKNNAAGEVVFDKAFSYSTVSLNEMLTDGRATYDAASKTYTVKYTAEEDTSALPKGVTATKASFDFSVKVKDDGKGTLTAEAHYPQGGLAFVNTYATLQQEVPVQISGSKLLTSDAGLTPPDIAGAFDFTIEALTEGAPLPEVKKVKNDAQGNISFGKMVFSADMLEGVDENSDGTRTKDFKYKVTEGGSLSGVTNDGPKEFTLTLKDDGEGGLTVIGLDHIELVFINTYSVAGKDSSITDSIEITKRLDGRTMSKGEFVFSLTDDDGKVVATGKNDADGKVKFDAVTYTKPGTYSYFLKEENNGVGGVIYDNRTYTVTTKVTDKGDGTLKVEHVLVGAEDGNAVFNNTYAPAAVTTVIGAHKTYENGSLKDGQFTFILKDEAGKTVSEASNDSNGTILFDNLEFNKAGTYKYTVSEVRGNNRKVEYDDTVYNVTVKVTDDGRGNLKASLSSSEDKSIVFVNTYHADGAGIKTGDSAPLGILAIMLTATAAAVVYILRRRVIR